VVALAGGKGGTPFLGGFDRCYLRGLFRSAKTYSLEIK
jgi:hypothetical protein